MIRDHIYFIENMLDIGVTSDSVRRIRQYIAEKVEPNDDDKASCRLYDLLTDLSYVDLSDARKAGVIYRLERERAEEEIRDALRDLEAYDVAHHRPD